MDKCNNGDGADLHLQRRRRQKRWSDNFESSWSQLLLTTNEQSTEAARLESIPSPAMAKSVRDSFAGVDGPPCYGQKRP
eukprot:scaffold26235_cov15-Cyclotella_meneghiniana.AAC.1